MDNTTTAATRKVATIFALVAAFAAGAEIAGADGLSTLPWEVWDDPRNLPRLTLPHQVLMRSSHCPDGCRFDRHSKGDSRFIRLDGDEGVIFEEIGPGAVTRIWMTQGDGVSQPLDPGIRLRIYLDGEAEPRVDESLPDFFAGNTPPFLAPMVGDRLVSSGGNFSYVPIPYREGCRVTLTGAKDARIWFQVTYHRLPDPGDVATFTGSEDLSRWSELLSGTGSDPWPETDPAEIAEGQVVLESGDNVSFYSAEGSGLLTGLRLATPAAGWDEINLSLTFDDRTTANLSLRDFFAIGRGKGLPTRSLLVGLDAADRLYTYFPMPYFGGVVARLARAQGGTGDPVNVSFWVRRSARLPVAGSGLFGAQLQSANPTTPGVEFPLLELEGAGKWVGLFADLGSVDTPSRQYLEGDERIYLDGSRHPALYGTGTEDIFGGGFYFDQGPFRAALHGMTYHLTPAGEDVTGAYRLFLTDAVTFGAGIRAGLETGPTGEMPMRARAVAYTYRRSNPALAQRDVLDLSDEVSLSDHRFEVTGDFQVETLAAAFEGEPPLQLKSEGYYRQEGEASFVLATDGCLGQPRLRRLLDAGLAGQAAIVRLDGARAAILPPIDPNIERRWREVDVDLATALSGDQTAVAIAYGGDQLPPPVTGSEITEFSYELWCLMDVLVFEDGFESGDASAWSAQVGRQGVITKLVAGPQASIASSR